MHKPSRTIVLAAVAVALAIPAFLYAAATSPGAEHWSHGHGDFMGKMAAQLNLTQDQKDKMKAVFTAHHQEMASQMTQIHQARTQLSNAIHADTFDETAIRTAAAAVAQADADAAVARGRMVSEMRQLLTPEQQAKAKELFAQHQQKADQHFNHMQQHMHGDPANPTPQN